ncbi:ImmA/IrrE family metallo-endopeptidase [Paenibacillus sp. FSL L8-0708]|uniref:ImmA/IrrE family metallo-endopeptidase n=1 Tax=Paenibacillus sp. FSL L8-0708 TaxID=2975311 RepID=UPI0030FA7DD4
MDIVQRLIRTHETNNPLKLAELTGITLYFEDLGENIWGYYTKLHRIPQIHLNNRLSSPKIIFAAGHELGHHFIHPHINTPFLKKNTLFSLNKIEREAHNFSVRLMVSLEVPLTCETREEFLIRCGVPVEFHQFY